MLLWKMFVECRRAKMARILGFANPFLTRAIRGGVQVVNDRAQACARGIIANGRGGFHEHSWPGK